MDANEEFPSTAVTTHLIAFASNKNSVATVNAKVVCPCTTIVASVHDNFLNPASRMHKGCSILEEGWYKWKSNYC